MTNYIANLYSYCPSFDVPSSFYFSICNHCTIVVVIIIISLSFQVLL